MLEVLMPKARQDDSASSPANGYGKKQKIDPNPFQVHLAELILEVSDKVYGPFAKALPSVPVWALAEAIHPNPQTDAMRKDVDGMEKTALCQMQAGSLSREFRIDPDALGKMSQRKDLQGTKPVSLSHTKAIANFVAWMKKAISEAKGKPFLFRRDGLHFHRSPDDPYSPEKKAYSNGSSGTASAVVVSPPQVTPQSFPEPKLSRPEWVALTNHCLAEKVLCANMPIDVTRHVLRLSLSDGYDVNDFIERLRGAGYFGVMKTEANGRASETVVWTTSVARDAVAVRKGLLSLSRDEVIAVFREHKIPFATKEVVTATPVVVVAPVVVPPPAPPLPPRALAFCEYALVVTAMEYARVADHLGFIPKSVLLFLGKLIIVDRERLRDSLLFLSNEAKIISAEDDEVDWALDQKAITAIDRTALQEPMPELIFSSVQLQCLADNVERAGDPSRVLDLLYCSVPYFTTAQRQALADHALAFKLAESLGFNELPRELSQELCDGAHASFDSLRQLNALEINNEQVSFGSLTRQWIEQLGCVSTFPEEECAELLRKHGMLNALIDDLAPQSDPDPESEPEAEPEPVEVVVVAENTTLTPDPPPSAHPPAPSPPLASVRIIHTSDLIRRVLEDLALVERRKGDMLTNAESVAVIIRYIGDRTKSMRLRSQLVQSKLAKAHWADSKDGHARWYDFYTGRFGKISYFGRDLLLLGRVKPLTDAEADAILNPSASTDTAVVLVSEPEPDPEPEPEPPPSVPAPPPLASVRIVQTSELIRRVLEDLALVERRKGDKLTGVESLAVIIRYTNDQMKSVWLRSRLVKNGLAKALKADSKVGHARWYDFYAGWFDRVRHCTRDTELLNRVQPLTDAEADAILNPSAPTDTAVVLVLEPEPVPSVAVPESTVEAPASEPPVVAPVVSTDPPVEPIVAPVASVEAPTEVSAPDPMDASLVGPVMPSYEQHRWIAKRDAQLVDDLVKLLQLKKQPLCKTEAMAAVQRYDLSTRTAENLLDKFSYRRWIKADGHFAKVQSAKVLRAENRPFGNVVVLTAHRAVLEHVSPLTDQEARTILSLVDPPLPGPVPEPTRPPLTAMPAMSETARQGLADFDQMIAELQAEINAEETRLAEVLKPLRTLQARRDRLTAIRAKFDG